MASYDPPLYEEHILDWPYTGPLLDRTRCEINSQCHRPHIGPSINPESFGEAMQGGSMVTNTLGSDTEGMEGVLTPTMERSTEDMDLSSLGDLPHHCMVTEPIPPPMDPPVPPYCEAMDSVSFGERFDEEPHRSGILETCQAEVQSKKFDSASSAGR